MGEASPIRGRCVRTTSLDGPELVGKTIKARARRHGVELLPIKPGRPTQNAYVERFNLRFRGEVLDLDAFSDLDEVRDESTRWLHRYNHDRPRPALDRHRIFRSVLRQHATLANPHAQL